MYGRRDVVRKRSIHYQLNWWNYFNVNDMPLVFFQLVTTDAAESYTRLLDFPKATKLVFSRLPFVFITIGGCTESLIATSIAAFGPKILESQYYVPAGRAALLFGLVTVSVALFGNMLGKSIRVNGTTW